MTDDVDERQALSAGSVAAARRCQVWRRADLAARSGVAALRAQIAARRWQAAVPLVVVTHNGPLTQPQKMWSALLAAPPGTLLHGLSALHQDGLRGFPPDAMTLVMPGCSASARSGQLGVPDDWDLALRWSTKLTKDDVNPLAIPPRTRPARSILDAASERVSERRSRVIVLAAVQQGLVRPAGLWDALSRRGRCRNRRLIVESIHDADGGMQSLPEREFDLLRRRLHLPEPRRQHVLRRSDGRYYLDDDWPDFGVRVEIHGIPHSRVANWDDDLFRQNDITVSGGLLIFSSFAVRHRQNRVGRQLTALFRRRGWAS